MINQAFPACICRDHEPATFDRPGLFLPIILIMFVSFGVLLAMADFPFSLQLGSFLPYTAFVFIATFSAQRGQQPYFFECPIVEGVMPRLIRRHIISLLIIVTLETIAVLLKRHIPASWVVAKGRDGSPFAIGLCVMCIGIAGVQIFTNRSLLERAHLEKRFSTQ
ncbi:MAG: hypothetical protein ACRYFU_01255 [Janthinobacterium lividum]